MLVASVAASFQLAFAAAVAVSAEFAESLESETHLSLLETQFLQIVVCVNGVGTLNFIAMIPTNQKTIPQTIFSIIAYFCCILYYSFFINQSKHGRYTKSTD